MSRERKRLKPRVKRTRREKVNPRRHPSNRRDGEWGFIPTPREAAALSALFGEAEGRAVYCAASRNLKGL